jgi:hypothetical protein
MCDFDQCVYAWNARTSLQESNLRAMKGRTDAKLFLRKRGASSASTQVLAEAACD